MPLNNKYQYNVQILSLDNKRGELKDLCRFIYEGQGKLSRDNLSQAKYYSFKNPLLICPQRFDGDGLSFSRLSKLMTRNGYYYKFIQNVKLEVRIKSSQIV